MTQHTGQIINQRSPSHRQEPMWECLVWWLKIPVFKFLERRKIGLMGMKPKRMIYDIAKPMVRLARLKADPIFKSP